MIPYSYQQYYGDETRWFLGIVIDINDPEQLGRVKVRIFGVHGENTLDVPNRDLPWAHIVTPVTEGGSSGIGANVGIKPLAQVYGIFLDGQNSQVPLVIGSIPKIETDRNVSDQRESKRGTVASYRNADTELLSSGKNTVKAFNFFTSVEGGSFTPEQACGILGNLHVENGVNLNKGKDLDPARDPTREPGGQLAYGLAQWNDSPRAANQKFGLTRYAELVDFSAKNGYNWRTMYAQLSFIKYELFKYGFLGLNKLQRTNTVDEAALVFEKKYLIPQPGSTETRQQEARNYFEEMV